MEKQNLEIQELRVGNWVQYMGNPCVVRSIDSDLNMHGKYRIFIVDTDSVTHAVDVEDLRPILITLDILNNNYESIGGDFYPNEANKNYYIDLSYNYVFIGKDEETKTIIQKPFMAVHQLQNLWFDIVHEVLNINLEII